MTLAEIAKRLNVSTMTIYRRLRRAGINLDTLRDSNGAITAAGASVIASMFDAPQDATQDTTSDATQCNSMMQHDATEQNSIRAAEDVAQIAILTAKLDAANDTIARLEAERDRLTAQLDTLAAALEREQTDRANERLLLTSGGGEQRRGLFGWLRRKT